jgi:serine/threonine protein kinase
MKTVTVLSKNTRTYSFSYIVNNVDLYKKICKILSAFAATKSKNTNEDDTKNTNKDIDEDTDEDTGEDTDEDTDEDTGEDKNEDNLFGFIFGRKRKWKIGSFIQKGGFGKVYNVQCVIGKVDYNGELVVKIETYDSYGLRNEEKIYHKLKKCSNIPKLIANGVFINNYTKYRYIILPKFNYTLLDASAFQKFNNHTLSKVVVDIMSAIKQIHNNGYCHLDIKSQNIMFCNTSNKWYLIDFGISEPVPEKERSIDMVGTPYYEARNVHEGLYSKKSDIESFLYTLADVSGVVKLEWKSLCQHQDTWKDKMYTMKCKFIKNRSKTLKHLESIVGFDEILKYFNNE